MRYLSILILTCVSCTPVPVLGVELVGDQVKITEQERHALTLCHREGGCHIVSKMALERAMLAVQEQTIEIAAVVATEHINEALESCRRGKI